ncbi:hypothetical protein B6V00_01150 [ANME-1 cluster archaeon ex4572_4]|nr:MAG: hypothetical protein B6V00_01150 [ANME-1 cluster archaeon ex4572_4]
MRPRLKSCPLRSRGRRPFPRSPAPVLLSPPPFLLSPVLLSPVLARLQRTAGSLAPDLDHKHSKIHRWSYTGSVSFGAALYLLSHEPFQALAVTAALVLTVFLLSRLKHRGFTHHAPGVVIFAVLLYAAFSVLNFSSPVVVTGFGVAGYLSHLAADFFSTRSKRKANKASKQTGKRASK